MGNEIDRLAQEHWEYTKQVIERTMKLCGKEEEEIAHILDFAHNLYIPAMIHGWKHKEESLRK